MTRAEREQQLLDVAEEVFSEIGYAEATMEQIAAAAGITKPVIYDHFGSKEKLLTTVVERARDELFVELTRCFDDMPKGASSRDYMVAGTRAFLDFFDRRRTSFRNYQQESAIAAAAGGDIEALRLAQVELIAGQFARIPGLDGLDGTRLLGVAEIVIAAHERIAGWLLRNPEITAEQATGLVVSVLWDGIGGFVTPPPGRPR